MKKENIVLGIVSKGRLLDNSIKYLRKRNFKILYDKDKRSLTGKIRGKNILVNFLHARQIVDLLSSGIISIGISGLDILKNENNSIQKNIKIIKKLNFGKASIMAATCIESVDINSFADIEEVSEEMRKKNQKFICSTKYKKLAQDYFIKKNIKNFSIITSHGATEVDPRNNISSIIVDVVESGKTLKSNNLKTFSDSKIMDTSACLFANKKALKNKNVLKVLNLLSK